MNKDTIAFMTFVKTYQYTSQYIGKTLEEIITDVTPLWEEMRSEEKEQYARLSLYNDENENPNESEFSSHPDITDSLESLGKKHLEFLCKMEEDIMESVHSSELIEIKYFSVVHMNNFCYCSKSGKNYPAEVAIAHFNLAEGVDVSNIYHKLCKPGAIPYDSKAAVALNSASTHKLKPDINNDNNMQSVFNGIVLYLSKLKENQKLPPIYAEMNNFKLVSNVIRNLCTDYGFKEDFIKVYSLNSLFEALQCAGDVRNKRDVEFALTKQNLTMLLESEEAVRPSNISCDFHALAGGAKFCSRTMVVRSIFNICKICSPDFNITLVPGRHVPDIIRMNKKRPGQCEDIPKNEVIYLKHHENEPSTSAESKSETYNIMEFIKQFSSPKSPEEKQTSCDVDTTAESSPVPSLENCENETFEISTTSEITTTLFCTCRYNEGREHNKCTGAYRKGSSRTHFQS